MNKEEKVNLLVAEKLSSMDKEELLKLAAKELEQLYIDMPSETIDDMFDKLDTENIDEDLVYILQGESV